MFNKGWFNNLLTWKIKPSALLSLYELVPSCSGGREQTRSWNKTTSTYSGMKRRHTLQTKWLLGCWGGGHKKGSMRKGVPRFRVGVTAWMWGVPLATPKGFSSSRCEEKPGPPASCGLVTSAGLEGLQATDAHSTHECPA